MVLPHTGERRGKREEKEEKEEEEEEEEEEGCQMYCGHECVCVCADIFVSTRVPSIQTPTKQSLLKQLQVATSLVQLVGGDVNLNQ